MTQELYEYLSLAIWLVMVLVAAAAMWPRKRGEEPAHPAATTVSRRQPAVAPMASRDDRP